MLSDARFAQVIYTLRVADAYFFAEARCRRTSRKPTHAKRRALELDLKVDTRKAAGMSSMEAYARHDPQIIQTYSPVLESSTCAVTTSWVTGPTANDLLNVNAALSEHLARTSQLYLHEATSTEQLMYPSSDDSCVRRSAPDVPSDAAPYLDLLSTHSSRTSTSTSEVVTPEDEPQPLKIRINLNKRKSCDNDNAQAYIEKRPKYVRKDWVAAFQ